MEDAKRIEEPLDKADAEARELRDEDIDAISGGRIIEFDSSGTIVYDSAQYRPNH